MGDARCCLAVGGMVPIVLWLPCCLFFLSLCLHNSGCPISRVASFSIAPVPVSVATLPSVTVVLLVLRDIDVLVFIPPGVYSIHAIVCIILVHAGVVMVAVLVSWCIFIAPLVAAVILGRCLSKGLESCGLLLSSASP